jgi:hypothetical protein
MARDMLHVLSMHVRKRVQRRAVMKKSLLSKTLIAFLMSFFACVCSSANTTANVTFRGDAKVAGLDMLGLTTTIAGTGNLPSTGGELSNEVLTVSVPGVLTGGVAHASTIGLGNHTDSSSSLSGLSLEVGEVVLTADFIESKASAAIANGEAATSGGSTLVNLVIAGQAITISGFPNQTVLVPGGKVVINETLQSAGAITVNALHISLTDIADLVLGSSHAAVGPCTACKNSCSGSPNCTSTNDFVVASGLLKDATSGNGYLTTEAQTGEALHFKMPVRRLALFHRRSATTGSPTQPSGLSAERGW